MKPHRFKFQAQFVEDVRAGVKRCTIRGARKRIAKSGEKALLEYWTARPYNSPVGQIGETELSRVTPIQIHCQLGRPLGIRIVRGGVELDHAAADQLARSDGFTGIESFAEFFRARLPFSGHHYEWATTPKPTHETQPEA